MSDTKLSADVARLLALAQSVAVSAGEALLAETRAGQRDYVHAENLPKEIKSVADAVMERHIVAALTPTGLPVLSEETGLNPGTAKTSDRWFIVDPLDGTFNFVKGLGPCAVSIAQWNGMTPLFGVIYSLTERRMIWGGPGLGAQDNGRALAVSTTSAKEEASICTGFPVRFDLGRTSAMTDFWELVRPFAKVRMIGSAAMSLVQVARGAADIYVERDIMLWDVAAGIAIVQGAGGDVRMEPGRTEGALQVRASNGRLG